MSSSSIGEIQEFIQIATEEESAQLKGDHREVNRLYDLLMKTGKRIVEKESGINELLILLKDQRENVMYWAAFFLLKARKKEALLALERISKNQGLVSFNAQVTLREFKSGRLELP